MKSLIFVFLFLITFLFSSCALMVELVGELFLGIEGGVAVEGAIIRSAVRGAPRAIGLRGASAAGAEVVLTRGMLAGEFSAVRLVRSGLGRPKLVVKAKSGKFFDRAELVSETQIRMLEPPYRVYEMPGRVYTIKNKGVWVKKSPDWTKDANILYNTQKDQLVMFYYEKGSWSYIGLPGLMIDGWVPSNQLVKADTSGRLPLYDYSIETQNIDPDIKAKFDQSNWNLNTLNDFKEYKIINSKLEGKYVIKIIDIVIDSWSEKNLFKLRFEARYVKKNDKWIFEKILNKQIIETKSKWTQCKECQGTGSELKYTNLICMRCWATGKVVCDACGDKLCPNCNGRKGDPCANCQSGRIPCGQCSQKGYIQYFDYKEKCGTCNGNGFYNCDNCRGKGFFICKNCRGSGRISTVGRVWIECETCSGSGHIQTQLVCKFCQGNKQIRTVFY